MNPLNEIKLKTIEMFLKFVDRLEVGYIDDYCNILHNISFIQSYSHIDGKLTNIYEHLMAHE